MPRVKIDYVVSFSDEDPENQASNLLSWEVSNKRWLCRAGEPSCSVVLQLARSVKISSLQIGVHHAALVEVLVGRSETPNEPYQVLVPRSVFVSPRESRGAPVERVRSFSGEALGAAVQQRWDRLRLVCSQPYNKHCMYGISFIQVFEPEGETPAAPLSAPAAPVSAPAVPPRMLMLETFSSDDEEFSPGELFAKHRQSTGDTGAQIRLATSKALNNNSDAATKLVKTSLSKHRPSAPAPATAPATAPASPPARDKDNLLYTKDDKQPHAKIDHIVQRHRDEKTKEQSKTPKLKENVKENKEKTPRSNREEPSSSKHSDNRRDKVDKKEHNDRRHNVSGKNTNNGCSSSNNRDGGRKRPHSDTNTADDECNAMGPVCEQPLSGVVFVLSGYQNPRRARIRDLATSLGALARGDWGPGCTHLINTPKLATVRAGIGGYYIPAPQAEWIEECVRHGRQLPWRWFACEPSRRLIAPVIHPEPSRRLIAPVIHPGPSSQHAESDADTDDEIEKVLRHNKKTRPSSPLTLAPSSPPRHMLKDNDDDDDDEVEFVKDERMQGSVTVEDTDSCDTDVEIDRVGAGGGEGGLGTGGGGTLPPLFQGQRFIVCETAPLDVSLLTRYIRAYGGLVIEPEEAEENGADCLVLCGGRERREGEGEGEGQGQGRRVRADWVWACHYNCQLLPIHDYLIT